MTKSDGWSSDYYKLKDEWKELDDIIVNKNMPWHIANIFKACMRYGQKNNKQYELNKIKWFADRQQLVLNPEQKEAPQEINLKGLSVGDAVLIKGAKEPLFGILYKMDHQIGLYQFLTITGDLNLREKEAQSDILKVIRRQP